MKERAHLHCFYFVETAVSRNRGVSEGRFQMAIYHLNVKTGTRIGGQSAKAKSDYNEREGPLREGQRGTGIQRIRQYAGMGRGRPTQKYWTAADAGERANGRLYREVEFALPRELNDRERHEVASSFAKKLTGEERLPYHADDPSRRRGRGESPRSPDVLRTDP